MDEHGFEKIESYLNGTMSREEQLRFKTELAANEELASTFRLYQAIEEEIQNNRKYSAQEALLRSSLQELNRKYTGNKTKRNTAQVGENQAEQLQGITRIEGPSVPESADVPADGTDYGRVMRISMWKKLAFAALLTGVVAIGALWFLQKRDNAPAIVLNDGKTDGQTNTVKPDTGSSKIKAISKKTAKSDNIKILQQPNIQNTLGQVKLQHINRERLEAMYAVYSKPDALPNQKADVLEEGDNSYEKREFKEAIAGYEAVITSMEIKVRGQKEEEKQTAFYAYYYRAQSYLAIDSVTKAIPDFIKAVKNSPDSYRKSKAQWYLALAFLKTGEVEKAAVLLKQVMNNNQAGEYRQRAVEIVKILYRNEKLDSGK